MRPIRLLLLAATLSACTARPTATPTAPPPTSMPPTPVVLPTITAMPAPTATATPAPQETPVVVPAALLAVQQSDGEVVVVTVDGEVLPLTAAPGPLYALTNLTGDVSASPQVYALGPAGPQPLDFIEDVSYGIAAWPDPATGQTRLAWDHYEVDSGNAALTSQIFVSDPGGSEVRELITESGTERVLRVVGWSKDGTRLFYSQEPLGLGGYILFSGVSDLWAYDWASGETTTVVPEAAAGVICLDDFNESATLAAHHCTQGQISVLDLNMGMTAAILPPPEVAGEAGVLGGARFSPAEDRLAFSVARNDPDAEQGWVAVSDGLAGPGRLVATAEAGDYFDVIDWLDDATLLLQSHGAAPALWRVAVDGGELQRLSEGVYLGRFPPSN